MLFCTQIRAGYEAIIQCYKNDLADSRAEIARLHDSFEKRERELIDRIIALTNPTAARVLNPPPLQPFRDPNDKSLRGGPARIHWPASDFGEGPAVGVPEKKAEGE